MFRVRPRDASIVGSGKRLIRDAHRVVNDHRSFSRALWSGTLVAPGRPRWGPQGLLVAPGRPRWGPRDFWSPWDDLAGVPGTFGRPGTTSLRSQGLLVAPGRPRWGPRDFWSPGTTSLGVPGTFGETFVGPGRCPRGFLVAPGRLIEGWFRGRPVAPRRSDRGLISGDFSRLGPRTFQSPWGRAGFLAR